MELWLPAGKDGPILLLSPNFDVIKVYNNSSNYALGVSLLGKAITGQSGLRTSWPRYERPLSTVQVKNLQRRLTSAGYDTKGADGIIGTNTRKAFQRWQAANGQTPDGFITQRSAISLTGW
jgi:peptidoglycan hydrolase-like protein with peptidoglycan-binding domain